MSLKLDRIIDVTISTAKVAATTATFNEGLIIGNSTVISTTDRVQSYTSLADMLTAGFTTSSVEYLAATLYFDADSAPDTVWIGRQGTSESLLEAVTACRAASLSWYAVYCCGAAKADHIAIAAYVESLTPASVYIYDTSDADALSGASGNVFESLNSSKYTRALGIYSTTTYAGAAVMGEAMGLNTGLANSAYTLKFKTLTGVTVESLTTTQVGIIEGNRGNVYVNYASSFDIFEQGVMAYNYYFDQVLYMDMLTNYIQIEVMNLLTSNNKIPLTDAGVTSLMNVVSQQCTALQTIGYIASSGTWSGTTVLNVSSGDSLSNGFVVQAPKVSTLTTSQRANREAPPIYVCLIEAGAVHSVSVGVYIQS